MQRRRLLKFSTAGLAGSVLTATGPSVLAQVKPSDATQIVDMSALELSHAIASRRVSCVEVMSSYLFQIDKLNDSFNAIVARADRAVLLEAANQADRELDSGSYRGWMHGFPVAIKDLAHARGFVTSMGSPLFANHEATQDSIHVARMKAAGAIVIGKSNVPEFGLGSQSYNTVYGVTGNAYDATLTAGGSSGGAAVALALRMVPVADGSDFMGSLRNPGAFNNVIGFRPTPGVVPLGRDFGAQLACNGPMGRNVADTARLLSTIAGYHPDSPASSIGDPATFAQPLGRDWRGVRIGWLGDFAGYIPTEAGLLSLCEKALHGFRAIGCEVEDVTLRYDMSELWQTWLVFRHWMNRQGGLAMYADPKKRTLLKPEMRWEIEGGASLTGDDVSHAKAARTAFYGAVNKLFERVDALVWPTAQMFPFSKDLPWPQEVNGVKMDTYHRWMEIVTPGTLAGCPVLNVPAGFSKTGLPMGLQVMTPRFADFKALQLGFAYEQATGWNLRVTPPALRNT